MGRNSSVGNTMESLATLFPCCLLLVLPYLAGMASASSSAISGNLVFNMLKSRRASGTAGLWDAAGLVKSLKTNGDSGSAVGSKKGDLIGSLPGQPHGAAAVTQYGGYVDVGDGGKLFYYFAEATGAKATKSPLMLWINGGPGCSSVGAGAFLQHGPFFVNDDGKTLRSNPYAWTNVSSIIYLDTPVNVGFSYSDNGNATTSYDDAKTAMGNLRFLLGWLERFPEYKSRDLYLAGDGYAGIYAPQLADLILEYNQQASGRDTTINLKKILLGNPTINAENEVRGIIDFQWNHGMVPTKTWKAIRRGCRGKMIRRKACFKQIRKLPYNDLGSGPVYPYDFTAKVCNPNLQPGHRIEDYYECDDKAVRDYLSQSDVQRALHGNSPRLSNGWIQCSDDVSTKYQLSQTSVPIIRRLVSTGLSVLIYSGDADLVVPMIGGRYTTMQLNLNVTRPWGSWFYNKATVGGFIEMYANETLVFATLRGAGHTVTKVYPERTLRLVSLLFTV
uniref:Serine carboxypeptidase-like 40 n=1 Tax=Anthurium amnicola TaxID=1678845 RepID=A0A1D1XKV6_9ARAE